MNLLGTVIARSGTLCCISVALPCLLPGSFTAVGTGLPTREARAAWCMLLPLPGGLLNAALWRSFNITSGRPAGSCGGSWAQWRSRKPLMLRILSSNAQRAQHITPHQHNTCFSCVVHSCFEAQLKHSMLSTAQLKHSMLSTAQHTQHSTAEAEHSTAEAQHAQHRAAHSAQNSTPAQPSLQQIFQAQYLRTVLLAGPST
jgi:hypothetical protein